MIKKYFLIHHGTTNNLATLVQIIQLLLSRLFHIICGSKMIFYSWTIIYFI
jgi:hypothetical protein